MQQREARISDGKVREMRTETPHGQSGGKRESIPRSCPLTNTHALTHVRAHTHTIEYKERKVVIV